MKKLKSKFRCIALDLPGHCGLDISDVSSLDDIGRYIRDFIENVGIEMYMLIGLSFGRTVVLNYLKNHESDKRILGAVIWGTPLIGVKKSYSFRVKALLSFIRTVPDFIFDFLKKPKRLKLISSLGGIPLKESSLIGFSMITRKNTIAYFDMMENEKIGMMPDVKKLFVYGTDDPFVSIGNYEYVKSLGNNSESILVDNGAHVWTNDGFNESMKHISTFLNKVTNTL